ncbi:hypothetical protein NQ314_010246 [Rhamnusium bicolor]|uniref:HTH psq-type domain-containing protein n=1 Tax=Rhamnusium bicolor TaxID=1586634 RepID=A0AAV8XUB6_9CUCU|nr:hypothetical protein NQ314_010246 [Rhamnusium bicolor]
MCFKEKMPRKGMKHKEWDPVRMRLAINAIRNKEIGYLKASRIFGVPKSTLEGFVKKVDKTAELVNTRTGRKPVFPKEMEDDLVAYCLEMDSHPFSKVNKLAGKKWMYHFLKRNPCLSSRKPQGISKARIKGFTPENVKRFFDNLEPAMKNIKFNPAKVGAISAAERGALVTNVMCMNAAGGFVPPLFVFPRKNMKAELLDGAPPGSIVACHPSGCIQQHIFTQWLHHFIAHVKPYKDDPVVLILDGHYSHTRNMDVIDVARENHISIICLPPHTLMCPAYLKSATAQNAVNGFLKAGIFPFNKDIFTDIDFIADPQRERPLSPNAVQMHDNVKVHEGTSPRQAVLAETIQNIQERTPPRHVPVKKPKLNTELTNQKKDKVTKRGRRKNKKGEMDNDSSSEDDEEPVLDDVSDMDCEEDTEDAECMFCNELFSKDVPGAYHKSQSSAVQVAKIVAVTVVLVSVVLGSFILASAYVTANASCRQLEQELELLSEAADRFQPPPQPEALIQVRNLTSLWTLFRKYANDDKMTHQGLTRTKLMSS